MEFFILGHLKIALLVFCHFSSFRKETGLRQLAWGSYVLRMIGPQFLTGLGISSIAYFLIGQFTKICSWITKILIFEFYFCSISRNKHLVLERLGEPD
jgi:cellulose synthase/poly-beta-1,6-N-acetylglucosamine synthase-like glycosyltransferase